MYLIVFLLILNKMTSTNVSFIILITEKLKYINTTWFWDSDSIRFGTFQSFCIFYKIYCILKKDQLTNFVCFILCPPSKTLPQANSYIFGNTTNMFHKGRGITCFSNYVLDKQCLHTVPHRKSWIETQGPPNQNC